MGYIPPINVFPTQPLPLRLREHQRKESRKVIRAGRPGPGHELFDSLKHKYIKLGCVERRAWI